MAHITKTRHIQILFTVAVKIILFTVAVKIENFQLKTFHIFFLNFAQIIRGSTSFIYLIYLNYFPPVAY